MKYLFGNMSFSLNCDDITNTALKKRIEYKLKFNFNAFEASYKDKHDVEFYFCDNFKDSNLIKYKDQDIEFGFCFQDCFKVYFICIHSNRGLFDIKFFSNAYVNYFEGLLIKFYHRVFLFFVLMVQSNKKFSLTKKNVLSPFIVFLKKENILNLNAGIRSKFFHYVRL